MTWILSIFSSIWKPIAAGAAGLLVFFFQRWRIKRKDALIDQQAEVIKAHEKIEETHRQDVVTDTNVEQKIQDIEGKVDHAENQEAAAGEVGKVMDEYFADRGSK